MAEFVCGVGSGNATKVTLGRLGGSVCSLSCSPVLHIEPFKTSIFLEMIAPDSGDIFARVNTGSPMLILDMSGSDSCVASAVRVSVAGG